MKLTLEIDTENLTEGEAAFFAHRYGLVSGEAYAALENELHTRAQEMSLLQNELAAHKSFKEPEQERFKSVSNSDIVCYLLSRYESMTFVELLSKIEVNEGTLRSTLYNLQESKIIDHSTTMPYKYFLKIKGDPEIAEALKNAGKVVVFK